MKPFNWAGMIAAIIVAELLAFAWYGPLFGHRWSVLMGRDPTISVMSAENNDMAIAVMATALWVGGLGWLSQRSSATGWLAGLRLGLVAWLLFAAPMQSFLYTYAGHDRALAPIDMGYTLVAFLLVGALVSGLRFGSPEPEPAA